LHIAGISFCSPNVGISLLFTVTCKDSYFARRVSAANLVCKDVDILREPLNSLTQILHIFQGLGFLSQYYIYIAHFLTVAILFSVQCFHFCLFVLYLCFFAGFINDTCAVKSELQ
jgi:hypothetical protein